MPSLSQVIAAQKAERKNALSAWIARKAAQTAQRATPGESRALFRSEYRALRRIYNSPTPEDDLGLSGGA